MPLWKVVAKLGFKLRLRVVAKYEHDSMSYYVAFSDLRGLNTDSELLDSLRANIKECALLLLEDYVKDSLPQEAQTVFLQLLKNKCIRVGSDCDIYSKFFTAKLDAIKESFKQDTKVLNEVCKEIVRNGGNK